MVNKMNVISESISFRIPKYMFEGIDFLVASHVHGNRAEVMRAAVENYLAFFQTSDGEKFMDGIERFRQLMIKRRKSETIGQWVDEIEPMLKKAIIENDLELVREIVDTCADAIAALPMAYQSSIKRQFESDTLWAIAGERVGKSKFWLAVPADA